MITATSCRERSYCIYWFFWEFLRYSARIIGYNSIVNLLLVPTQRYFSNMFIQVCLRQHAIRALHLLDVF